MSRGLEYLVDNDELDDIQSFEKIKHKPKLLAHAKQVQKRRVPVLPKNVTIRENKYPK